MPQPLESPRRRRDLVRGLPMHARYATDQAPEGRLPVVLVHGLVISSSFFVPALRRLSADQPTYAPDLPGYGLSAKPPQPYDLERQADYLGAWMDTLGIARAAVVGCSLGSQIVSHLAIRRPELIAGAILVSPTMDPAARNRLVSMARWARELPYEISMLPLLLRDYARAGLRGALDGFEMAITDEPERRLPKMRMPSLVLRGELDPLVSQAWAESVAELLPAGQLKVVRQQAHAINFTAPDQFARLVREFANSLDGARVAGAAA